LLLSIQRQLAETDTRYRSERVIVMSGMSVGALFDMFCGLDILGQIKSGDFPKKV